MTLFGAEQTQATSDDYYTPDWIFRAMGLTFDLDVASPPSGVPWIPCDRFYSMADDGLVQAWFGRVWMNPPFSRPGPWVTRFIEHGHGVALLPFAKSAWFDDIWQAADGLTFPGVDASRFVGGPIPTAVMLAAFGAECVEAIGRVAPVRRVA
jgi:hypothetical protein